VRAVELPAVVIDLLNFRVVYLKKRDVAQKPWSVIAKVLTGDFFDGQVRLSWFFGLGHQCACTEDETRYDHYRSVEAGSQRKPPMKRVVFAVAMVIVRGWLSLEHQENTSVWSNCSVEGSC